MDKDKALLGYRSWYIEEGNLRPVCSAKNWKPGLNMAECVFQPEHSYHNPAGTDECHCGFNAWHSLSSAERYEMLEIGMGRNNSLPIVGAIAGAGDTRIHSLGFRSEQAQVIAFYLSSEFRYGAKALEDIKEIASKFNVQVFENKQEFLDYTEAQAEPFTDYDSVTASSGFLEKLKFWDRRGAGEIRVDGVSYWFKDNLLHRTDGPAFKNGEHEEYWVEGKRHRTDGPAFIQPLDDCDVYREYWIDGELVRSE